MRLRRQRAELQERQHGPQSELLHEREQPLAHGLGAPHERRAPPHRNGGISRARPLHHGAQVGKELHQGGRVDVAGRHPHLAGPDEAGRQRALEVRQVRCGLRDGLLVGVGDVHRGEPPEELGVEHPPGARHGVAIGGRLADEGLRRRVVRHPHVAEAVLGAVGDGGRRPEAGDPHRRMGLLQRSGPGVHVGQLVVVPVERERARARPRLEHEVNRFAKPGAGLGGVDVGGVVLGAAADHEPGDEPAPAHDVEHGHLLGDTGGGVVEGQRVAEDADLHPAGLACQGRRHQVGRRHEPVGVLVMLVDDDAVEPELLGHHQLRQVALVELAAERRVVLGIGERDPGGLVGGQELAREGPGTATA